MSAEQAEVQTEEVSSVTDSILETVTELEREVGYLRTDISEIYMNLSAILNRFGIEDPAHVNRRNLIKFSVKTGWQQAQREGKPFDLDSALSIFNGQVPIEQMRKWGYEAVAECLYENDEKFNQP